MSRTVLLSAIVLAALGAGWFLFSQIPSTAVVRPHEQGVVVSNGQVVGILPPGPHQFDGRTQQVFVYPTSMEREYRLPEPISVADCASEVKVVWRIEDVAAWHLAADRANVGPAFATEVSRISETFTNTDFEDDPRTEMQVFVNKQMEDFRVSGAARRLVLFGVPRC